MTEGQTGWIFLFMLSLFLIIIGIQGNLGLTVAILFVPSKVEIGNEGLAGTPIAPGG